MTKDFRDWWIIFADGLLLFLLFCFSRVVRTMCLLLWLPSLGRSTRWYNTKIGKWFPDFYIETCYSPDEPFLAFYDDDTELSIQHCNKDTFSHNVRLYIKRPSRFPAFGRSHGEELELLRYKEPS
jgi:hypothetical protein